MRISSILENQKIEKRISITPEIAKKYIALGLEVILSENYGVHLGIKDEYFTNLGVKILKDENEVINNADIIVQLALLSDDKSSLLKENQTFIGVLNPYDNKDHKSTWNNFTKFVLWGTVAVIGVLVLMTIFLL